MDFILGIILGALISSKKPTEYNYNDIGIVIMLIIFALSFIGTLIFNIYCWIKEKE